MGFTDEAPVRARSLGRGLGALTALAAVLAFAPAPAGAAGITCSATALRVGSLSTPTANATGASCQKAEAGTEWSTNENTVRVLGAGTTATGTSGTANADVLRVDDAGTSGPTTIRALESDAYVSCQHGKPVVVGGSSPAGVQTTAQTGSVFLPSSSVTVPGLVYLNEIERGTHGATYRALRVGPQDGGIVVGESSAGSTGNPC
jgi:hypothetical protein